MLLRVGLAVDRETESLLSDALASWSLSTAGREDAEVDIALLRGDFSRLSELYPDLDMAFLSRRLLREHLGELLRLNKSNPGCLPVAVGCPAEELPDFLALRPGGLLTGPWGGGEIGELSRRCLDYLSDNREVIQIRTRHGCAALSARSVLFCQSDKKYVCLVPEKGRVIKKLGKLDDLALELPEWFVRLHQSFLVNSRRVTALDRVSWEVILDTGDRVPVSRAYRASAQALFQKCPQAV